MAEQIVNARIQQKYKTLEEWKEIWDEFVPLKGEVCTVMIPAGYSLSGIQERDYERVLTRTGDGVRCLKDLPWDGDRSIITGSYSPSRVVLSRGEPLTIVSSVVGSGENSEVSRLTVFREEVTLPPELPVFSIEIGNFRIIPRCDVDGFFEYPVTVLYHEYCDSNGPADYRADECSDKLMRYEILDSGALVVYKDFDESDDGIDYEEPFYYAGQQEIDGLLLDRWIKQDAYAVATIYTEKIVAREVTENVDWQEGTFLEPIEVVFWEWIDDDKEGNIRTYENGRVRDDEHFIYWRIIDGTPAICKTCPDGSPDEEDRFMYSGTVLWRSQPCDSWVSNYDGTITIYTQNIVRGGVLDPRFTGQECVVSDVIAGKDWHTLSVVKKQIQFPPETELSCVDHVSDPQTLTPGDSFTAVTSVEGYGHTIVTENTVFTLPEDRSIEDRFANEDVILSARQFGDTLPSPGSSGRIFFLKVDE